MDRPIPSLREWLGDGARADDFEAYVRDLMAAEYGVTDENEKACVRMMRTLTIACIEIARIETERHGRNFADTLRILGRATGIAIMGPILSATRDDPEAPLRELIEVVIGDFRHGALIMAKAQDRRK